MLATILGANAKHGEQNTVRKKQDTKAICELQTIPLAQRRESESQAQHGSQKFDKRSPVNCVRRDASTATYRIPIIRAINSRMSPASHYMQTSELRSRASQPHDIASQKYVNGFEARSRFPGESGLLRLSFTAR